MYVSTVNITTATTATTTIITQPRRHRPAHDTQKQLKQFDLRWRGIKGGLKSVIRKRAALYRKFARGRFRLLLGHKMWPSSDRNRMIYGALHFITDN